MKSKSIKALVIFACAALISLGSTSCGDSTEKQREKLTTLAGYANTALTLAQIGGVINEKQAALARQAGALILETSATTGTEAKVAVISEAVLAYVEKEKKMTPEQIDALRKAGTVNLMPPVSPLLPDPGAVPGVL